MSRALLGTVIELPCAGCGEPVKALEVSDPDEVLTASLGTGAALVWCALCFAVEVQP